MNIYIAGKITGLDPRTAREAFDRAESYLTALGHEAVNPMAKVSEQQDKTWIEYMCEDMAFVLAADALYMLPNWTESKGARVEHAVALELGLDIFYARTPVPLVPLIEQAKAAA